MKVKEAIHPATPALQTSDSVEDALGRIMEHRVRHLPVVDQDDLVGIISEEQLMSAPGPDAEIGSLLAARPVSVSPGAHIFDAARTMVEHDLSTVPVSDESGHYLGLIRRHDIFDQFAHMLATQEAGAILALEVDDPRDYALAKLIHVIEQNEAKVLAVASESPERSTDKIRLTLKLNVKDTSRVRHVLEHHGYHVVASFGEEEGELGDLVEEFMRYLEV